MKIKERFYRFMYGRYGSDQFSRFMLIVYFALWFVTLFVDNEWIHFLLILLYNGLFVLLIYRMFSRNIYARQRENLKYLSIKEKILEFFRYYINRWKCRKTHVYKKCPACRSKLRLPKKKGDHNVRCPKCSNVFKVKI